MSDSVDPPPEKGDTSHADRPDQRYISSTRTCFRVSATSAFLCMTLLVAWSASDASFRMAVWQARVSLRLESIQSADPEIAESLGIADALRAVRWDSIGKRVIGLWCLYGLGFAASGMTLLIAARGRTWRRGTVGAAVMIGWCLLSASRTGIDEWRTTRQVSALLPRFEETGASLHRNWPVESGELPNGVRFFVAPERYPDVLLLRGPRASYPLHEDFGLMIHRGQNAIIRFDLAAAFDSCVEFHPNGTVPTAHSSGFGYPSPPVASVIRLKDNWFLVRYAGS